MPKLIIVPIDGSPLGEQALPLALHIARRERAELELVHVVELVVPSLVGASPPIDATVRTEARRNSGEYLDALAARVRDAAGVYVRTTILDGDVEPRLVEHIAARHADLVVMSTHGHGGLSRLWIGSVANEVARNSSAPVLLRKASDSEPPPDLGHPAPFRHVLIPLDGSRPSEEAIEHALIVARDEDVAFHLLHVLPLVPHPGAVSSVEFPNEEEHPEAVMGFLADLASRIRSRGISADFRAMRHRSPARAILEVAEEIGADLIAMDSLARHGLARRLAGSVSDKVLHGATVPVLLHRLRPEDAAAIGAASEDEHSRGHGD